MKEQSFSRQYPVLARHVISLLLISILFQSHNRAEAKPPERGSEASNKADTTQSVISSSFLFGSPCFNRLRPVDVVFIVDTSGSMLDDQGTVNSFRSALSNAIIEEGVDLMRDDLGITETVIGFNLQDNVLNRFGATVPGNPLLN